ncbi:MAG: hypothetical protein AAB795_00275 [Patescibacteria group bacterium]
MKFKKLQKNNRGFVALIIVVIIAIVATTIAVSVSLSGLGELAGSYMTLQSHTSFDSADSCIEEALIRLSRNSSYTGGTIVLNNIPCTIIINVAGSNRTITVQSTSTRAVHNIRAEAVLGSAVTLSSWFEIF